MPFRFRAPAHPRFPVRKAKKSAAAQEVLDRLNAYLDAAEPEPVYWLTQLWENQQKAVTYKELREAITNGHISEATLAAWQQDYTYFVNEKLKPLWIEAMQEGAAKLAAAHPDYFFDPMTEGIRNWTQTHGAEWITNITGEAREAITGMIDHASTGAWTVDELSRAIRPTIGLTKPQALANLNHYQHVKASLLKNHPKMKVEAAEKKAQEAALKYAARQHRQRAYTIATTEMAFAYNKGADDAIKQAIEQGLVGKTVRVWSTAADEMVCPICNGLEGAEVDMEGEFDFKGKSLYGGQKQTPPAHPRCRCALEYREVEPPAIETAPPEPPPQWEEAAPEPELSEPQPPTIPASLAIPEGMVYEGKINLGGTGEMHDYKDATGQEWLFKPAQSKGGKPEAFRAHVQEAGYKVQGIIDPETAVPVGTGEFGGKFGAFQKKVTNTDESVNFKAWQETSGPLPAGTAPQLQREHVTDWLLGNFDSHGGNFVIDDAGRLIGLDKEQAFKYIKNAGGQKMSYAFHPNKTYGETEPIYNTLYRRFAKGELDLNLQDTLTYIKRAEAMPNSQYREIFRGYAETLHGKGKAAEELLDQIVERKTTLRETYRSFYSDLLTERTGKKQAFIWADEAAQHIKQPIAAVQHTTDTLKAMNVSELKQLAKQKGIPYYNKFNKGELVEAVADPVKAVEISAQTKAKLLQLEATRDSRLGQPATPAAAPMPKTDIIPAADVFKDMSIIPVRRYGVPVSSDKGMVEGLNITTRRMTIDGKELYEITGKLSKSTWSETWDKLKGQSEVVSLTFESANDANAIFSKSPINMHGIDLKARRVEDAGQTFELYVHNGKRQYNGWQGFFRLRVPVTENGANDAKAAKALLEKMGLGEITTTPTAEAEEIFKKTRLLWQNAPRRMPELDGLQGKKLSDMLDVLLKQEGIDVKRIKNMVTQKVIEGYSTFVETGIGKEYENAGLRYVWAGVNDADSVVKITQSPGLLSNNNRGRGGIGFGGASAQEDMERGGSDSVFTRIGVKTKTPQRYDNCFMGGNYRIIINPKEMQRTDWYAYTKDNYGRTSDSEMVTRPSPIDFIKQMATSYQNGNEIMFRQGIARESFTGISCQSEALRADLLKKFKEAGITVVNGIPVKDFVKVGKEI